ncbi:antibiotic biosynthesis monooxygenase family protein [Blastococcus brunescens]|uniref:Antibiotic biosynthesis monooxygenase family protein n=1 Tax=Blastococcus brunescens TaxID=1564165 RepID=A0ABZ1AYA0_9ACTN|nr:antibiotic biosynthesis monooxygenase family protein [Blastococcus sp. BMG 8361]WRL62461.1 antibiotic biosynthesis monooxygenase family protein [Blastococcus sp. BMG 8361]
MSVPLRLRARFGGDDSSAPNAEPVTVTVARVVRPDQREAFEREATAALRIAAAFPGNLGATLLRPGPDSSEYHLVYRFADDESLAAWEGSAERREFLSRLRGSWRTSATPGSRGWTVSSPGRRRRARAGG